MGFRNPARSALAVDTGGGAIPGVKVYSDQGNPGTGVVEWDTYLSSVVASLSSAQSASGGSYFTVQLSDPNVARGPSLTLGTRQPPAGGPYVPMLGISDSFDVVESYNGNTAGGGFFTTGFRDYGPAPGPGGNGWGGVVIYRDASGWAHIEGMVSVVSGLATANSGTKFATVKPHFAPGWNRMFDAWCATSGGTASSIAMGRLDIRPDGGLYLIAHPAIPAAGYINLNCHYYVGNPAG